jgi:3-methyladenine DNA glycosylase AlkC
MTTPVKRKGARSTKDISPEIRAQLNSGQLETANLVEWLAVDQRVLLTHLLQQANRTAYLAPVLLKVDGLSKQTVNTINEAIGTGLLEQATKKKDTDFLSLLANHPADLVRCWATYTIGKNTKSGIAQTLAQIQPFAADKHFGVREISWLAVRHKIAAELEKSIALLANWVLHPDENIRRFATESTRPRGVWCEHIDTLKQQPEQALALLEPLKNDPAKYVQDSVGNWLNDASKTRPDFVLQLCDKWNKESKSKATAYITKKALRTLQS